MSENPQQPAEQQDAQPTAETPSQPAPETPQQPAEASPEPATAQESPTQPIDQPAEQPAHAAVETVEQPAEPTEPIEQPAAPKPSALPARPRPTPPGGAPKPGGTPAPAPAQPAPPMGQPGAHASAAPVAPAAPAALDPQAVAAAAAFGRVDEEGNVFVREGEAERRVGQVPAVPAEQAMDLYIRRYLDLDAQVALLETRVRTAAIKDVDKSIASLTEGLAEPAAVGDIAALRTRLAAIEETAAGRRAEAEAERAAARARALAEREEIVAAAEAVAAQDPRRTQWKQSGEKLRTLLGTWQQAQKRGPRLERPDEDALWKRFSHARTTFDRHRRQYFSELDAKQGEAKAAKEALIARAEALSSSTDWGRTSGEFRRLMDEWKAAGRANRKEDDALWARFRAAQQAFFDARNAVNAATDAEYAENLKVKESILVEAEKLVPVKNLGAAKSALRDLQDRWEQAGKVPRADIQRVEGRMRKVEQAVRDAEDAEWKRSNPETQARADGMAAQLEAAIAGLEADLDAAKAEGDERKIAAAQEALDARHAWLTQVRAAQN